MTNPAAERYLTERVMTASPAELTAMLYDACVGAVKASIRLHEAGQFSAAGPRLIKAQEILLELRTTLNKDAGKIAQDLDSLYTYAYSRLLDANLRHDTPAAREALSVIEPLQLAWREACLPAGAGRPAA